MELWQGDSQHGEDCLNLAFSLQVGHSLQLFYDFYHKSSDSIYVSLLKVIYDGKFGLVVVISLNEEV
ncbi:hypothetical protein V6Z12_A05G241500 [Gossypium hirsutum]